MGAARASQQETGLKEKQELAQEGAGAALPHQAGSWAMAVIRGSSVMPGASGRAPAGAWELFRQGLALCNTRTQRFLLSPLSFYPCASPSTGALGSYCRRAAVPAPGGPGLSSPACPWTIRAGEGRGGHRALTAHPQPGELG